MSGECVTPGSTGEAVELVRQAINSKAMLVLAGRCWVEYEGRGASKSTPGDRLVIVKPSGAILVHGPRGFRPENWQPDGSVFHVVERGGVLLIRAVRRRPREVLLVYCDRVYSVQALHPRETGDFVMYMSESEIRDALARHPELLEEGLRVVELEKPVPAGFVDLFAQDREGRMVVVEIKRVKAGEEAVRQLEAYLEALEKRGVRARGILAAPGFTEAAVREAGIRGIRLVHLDLARLRRIVEEERRRSRTLQDFLGF